MKAFFRYSLLLLSLLLFALVVADLRAEFQYLAEASAWILVALGAVSLVGVKRAWPNQSAGRSVVVLLLFGALLALLVRTLGYERAALRSVAVWESARKSEGERIATKVSSQFEAICATARRAARQLARSSVMENALHALNGEGDVAIYVTKKKMNGSGFVEIVVSDTGVGIDPELRERIFEPYFSTRAAGTGLGLAIAKKVVEDHGGTITLESERGQGTSVRMLLPSVRH